MLQQTQLRPLFQVLPLQHHFAAVVGDYERKPCQTLLGISRLSLSACEGLLCPRSPFTVAASSIVDVKKTQNSALLGATRRLILS